MRERYAFFKKRFLCREETVVGLSSSVPGNEVLRDIVICKWREVVSCLRNDLRLGVFLLQENTRLLEEVCGNRK